MREWFLVVVFFRSPYKWKQVIFVLNLEHTHTDTDTDTDIQNPMNTNFGKKKRGRKHASERERERMCALQWFFVAIAVVLFSSMFSYDVRIICIIPMDFICCFLILFIKNLCCTMCVYYISLYWKWGRDKEWNEKKRWIQCSLQAKLQDRCSRAPRFSVFSFALLLSCFVFLFFVFYIYITLPSSQCQQHWFGQMTALLEMNEAQKML